MVAAAALALLATACSGSGRTADSAATTTKPPTTNPPSSSPGSTTSGAATTTSTVPPKVTKTPVTSAGGAVVGTVTAVEGDGPATIALPPEARPTALVHARYTGDGTFVVSSVNAQGGHLAVLAQSLGSYDGTFPVGFVDESGNPATGLRVETTGPWHLDIGEPSLARELPAGGVSGRGDVVLSYRGPKVSAHVIYAGTSAFSISTFAHGAVSMLVSTAGPYDGRITLPAGPAFISVTAAGDWSMSLG